MVSATDLEYFVKNNKIEIKEEDKKGIEEFLTHMPTTQIFIERVGDIDEVNFQAVYLDGKEAGTSPNFKSLCLVPDVNLVGVFYDEMKEYGAPPIRFESVATRTGYADKPWMEFKIVKDWSERPPKRYALRIYLTPKKKKRGKLRRKK